LPTTCCEPVEPHHLQPYISPRGLLVRVCWCAFRGWTPGPSPAHSTLHHRHRRAWRHRCTRPPGAYTPPAGYNALPFHAATTRAFLNRASTSPGVDLLLTFTYIRARARPVSSWTPGISLYSRLHFCVPIRTTAAATTVVLLPTSPQLRPTCLGVRHADTAFGELYGTFKHQATRYLKFCLELPGAHFYRPAIADRLFTTIAALPSRTVPASFPVAISYVGRCRYRILRHAVSRASTLPLTRMVLVQHRAPALPTRLPVLAATLLQPRRTFNTTRGSGGCLPHTPIRALPRRAPARRETLTTWIARAYPHPGYATHHTHHHHLLCFAQPSCRNILSLTI